MITITGPLQNSLGAPINGTVTFRPYPFAESKGTAKVIATTTLVDGRSISVTFEDGEPSAALTLYQGTYEVIAPLTQTQRIAVPAGTATRAMAELVTTGVANPPIFNTLEAHASTHSTGGSDPVAPADIGAATSGHNHDGAYDPAGSASAVAGDLSSHTGDTNNPHGVTAEQVGAAAASHQHGLDDVTDAGTAAAVDVPAEGDAASDEAVLGNDSRLADARTPVAHASSHEAGGSDPITMPASVMSSYTVATLPAAPDTNTLAWCSDCINVHGKIGSVVRYTGAQWELIGAAGVVPTTSLIDHVYRMYMAGTLTHARSSKVAVRSMWHNGFVGNGSFTSMATSPLFAADSTTGEQRMRLTYKYDVALHISKIPPTTLYTGTLDEQSYGASPYYGCMGGRVLLVDYKLLTHSNQQKCWFRFSSSFQNTADLIPSSFAFAASGNGFGLQQMIFCANSNFSYFNYADAGSYSSDRRVVCLFKHGSNLAVSINGATIWSVSDFPEADPWLRVAGFMSGTYPFTNDLSIYNMYDVCVNA